LGDGLGRRLGQSLGRLGYAVGWLCSLIVIKVKKGPLGPLLFFRTLCSLCLTFEILGPQSMIFEERLEV
jgi:hypothetical protein